MLALNEPAHYSMLSDSDFEDVTQFTLGSKSLTEWLVLFCAPDRFHHCKNALSIWQELSYEMSDEINLAFVDT